MSNIFSCAVRIKILQSYVALILKLGKMRKLTKYNRYVNVLNEKYFLSKFHYCFINKFLVCCGWMKCVNQNCYKTVKNWK